MNSLRTSEPNTTAMRDARPRWEHAAGGASNPFVAYYRALLSEQEARSTAQRRRAGARQHVALRRAALVNRIISCANTATRFSAAAFLRRAGIEPAA